MGKVLSALKRACVYDPDTGTVVQFNRIATDLSEFTKTPIQTETTQGLTFGGYESNLAVGFLESGGLTQLKTWMEADNYVRMAAEFQDHFVLFQESEELNFERGIGVNARDGVSIHLAGLQHIGAGDQKVFINTNLIEAGSGAFNIFDNSQTYTFFFPVEGATISVAADYANYSADVNLRILAYDYGTDGTDGSQLSQTSVTVDGNGRFSASLELPANTYLVRVEYNSGGNFADGDITNRTIRVGDDATYVDY